MKIVEYFKNHKKLKYIILGVIAFITIILSGHIYGDDNYFQNPTFGSVAFLNNNSVVKFIVGSVPKVLTTYFVISIAEISYQLVHYGLDKVLKKNQRSETILKMLYSFSKYGIAILVGLFILTVWGVDSGALLASAGGLALVVGLGAQSLIADVLAGVFIVFEGEFNVGDIVIIDSYRGKVLSIGIRSTKIRDIYGDIKTINNAQITTVINKTKELSMADVVVGINYGESIEKVEAVFRKEIKHIKSKIAEAEEEVAYLGVQDLSASSVDLLFITYCKEENVAAVKRKMRRELKIIFDKYNIEIPYQHITLENKEGGFESTVVIEEDFNNTQEENVDFENLLFNKSIPDKNDNQDIQKTISKEKENNEPLFDDNFSNNKVHYIQPKSISDDEYVVGGIEVLNIGNNSTIQQTFYVDPEPIEEYEYSNNNSSDVYIEENENHQKILITTDDNILDEIIDDLIHDNNENLEKIVLPKQDELGKIVLPKEEKNNDESQVKKTTAKKKNSTNSNKKKKVITENVKEDINPEITNLEQALGSFIEEEKK